MNGTGTLAPVVVDGGDVADDVARTNEETGSSLKAEQLLVYPNPTRGECTIKATSPGVYYLMNEMGVLVRSITLNADNQNTINLTDLSTGTYVIAGQSKSGIVKQKLIVNH